MVLDKDNVPRNTRVWIIFANPWFEKFVQGVAV